MKTLSFIALLCLATFAVAKDAPTRIPATASGA